MNQTAMILGISVAALLFVLRPYMQPLAGKIICIDPGHGGFDPGAVGIGVRESDVVLAVSLELAKLLQRSGARVVMTRATDENPAATAGESLTVRKQIAYQAGADLFISIHANGDARPSVNGTETYYYSQLDLTLAQAVQRELLQALGLRDRGVKFGDFLVLRGAYSIRPSILIELGFITNPTEVKVLTNPRMQRRAAQAIHNGIVQVAGGRR